MPGFTQPTEGTASHSSLTTLEHTWRCFTRDYGADWHDIREQHELPVRSGAGALAGTTYPLDQGAHRISAGLLTVRLSNSMDSVADRDYLHRALVSAMATIMMHLAAVSPRRSFIWNSNEYQFVELDDAYSTGSSIMPQKKNPDIAELVRGKTGRGLRRSHPDLLTTMKGIPLAYNKDMQEDKELTFDAIDTVKGCLALFTGMIATMTVNKPRMEASAKNGFTNATDAAALPCKSRCTFP